MSTEIYITITGNDVVRVDLDYRKGRGVVLSAYPAERKEHGYYVVEITSGEYAVVEPMARLNRKRLETIASLTRNELSLKTGRAWDLVKVVCTKKGWAVP